MKRLLEWKQRMLQSPLTRKSGNSVVSGGSGARSSERSTPTLADRDAPSPRIRIESPVQPQPSKSFRLFRTSTLSYCLAVHPLGALNIPARIPCNPCFHFPSCRASIGKPTKNKRKTIIKGWRSPFVLFLSINKRKQILFPPPGILN